MKVKEYPKEILLIFEATFSTKHLSAAADTIRQVLKKREDKPLVFGLSLIEWIGHEELVFLSALFYELYLEEIPFRIKLRSKDPSERQALQIIQLWDTWKIYSFLPVGPMGTMELEKYFDIDFRYINHLKKNVIKTSFDLDGYSVGAFTRITPFLALEHRKKEDEKLVSKNLEDLLEIDEYLTDLLSESKITSPFVNKTLSRIITKELYENSYEHAFPGDLDGASYFGVSFINEIRKAKNKEEILEIQRMNFDKEAIPETFSFYTKNGVFLNRSYIQYTFIDFGKGIPETLENDYNDNANNGIVKHFFNPAHSQQRKHTRILEYAFSHSSTSNPIGNDFFEKDSISRGLYDVLSIIRRYKGVLIARSGYGKILYNFAEEKSIPLSLSYFDAEHDTCFKGTCITIILPRIESDIVYHSIKPEQNLVPRLKKGKKTYYLSINYLIKTFEQESKVGINETIDKGTVYLKLFSYLRKYLESRQAEETIIYFDFDGVSSDQKYIKKLLQYLASSYYINESTNAIIINPPDNAIVQQLHYEILNAPTAQKFNYHPIPCIYQKERQLEQILWLGIKNKEDAAQLNTLVMFKETGLRRSDFDAPEDIMGNLFRFDESGNLISDLQEYNQISIEAFVARNTKREDQAIFLCSGNYYQKEFISFLETLQDDEYAYFIAKKIVKLLQEDGVLDRIDHIIAITLSSQLLGKAMISVLKREYETIYEKVEFIRLSNYNSFNKEELFDNIRSDANALLVCDVISTGFLISKLKNSLHKKGVLVGVATIVDTRYQPTKNTRPSFFDNEVPTFSLSNFPLEKYDLEHLSETYKKYNVIRINPITNGENTLSIKKSQLDNVLFPEIASFLDTFPFVEKYLHVGNFRFNNVHHTYFVDTDRLFKLHGIEILKSLISDLFKRNKLNLDKIEFVFYPLGSGIEQIDHDDIKRKILNNHHTLIFPLSRFMTPLGWRFSFPPKFLNSRTQSRNILILDDGSCTGATIAQMVDEVCFLGVQSITFLSVFGRLEDFQREFYSRISSLNAKENEIPIRIAFGTNWNIPIYPTGNKNPAFEEISLIHSFLSSKLLPSFMISVLEQRQAELEATHPAGQNLKNWQSLSYLPKNKPTKGKTTQENEVSLHPIKDMFIYRDIVGKIDGYRFYREYFEFYDDFTATYYQRAVNNPGKIRFKSIELLVSVLLHESYLAETVWAIVPDVHTQVLRFIDTILKNDKGETRIYYEWKRGAIIKAFFTMNKSFFISNADNTDEGNNHIAERINGLLNFASNDDEALNEIFYGLLYYIPSSPGEIRKMRPAARLNRVVKEIIMKHAHSMKIMLLLKQFSNILNLNPYIYEDVNNSPAAIEALTTLYKDENNIANHVHCLNAKFGVIQARLDDCVACINQGRAMEEYVIQARSEWEECRERIEKIIRYTAYLEDFSREFQNGKLYNISHKNDLSFLSVYSVLNEIMHVESPIWDADDLENIRYYIYFLRKNMIEKNSIMCKLFLNDSCNLVEEWHKAVRDKEEYYEYHPANPNFIFHRDVAMPAVIVRNIVKDKIASNFRHAIDKIIWQEWETDQDYIKLHLKNRFNFSQADFSGFEKSPLNNISTYYPFKYEFSCENGLFIQTFTFKLV